MTRSAVVAEARSWIGTPYHHRGAIRGVGVDCAQLPMLVYSACGLFPAFDPGEYAGDWHLHRSEERYLTVARRHAREIDGDPAPGDFALFRIGRCFAHGAIVTEWPRIVHAMVDFQVVEDLATGGKLGRQPFKLFTLW